MNNNVIVVFLVMVLLISPFLTIKPLNTHAQQNDNGTQFSSSSTIMNKSDTLNTTKQNQYTKTYESRIGNLTTQYGYVTSETAKRLSDEFFFQTAVQVYLLALPAVSGAGIFNGADKMGVNNTDILYWSQPMTSDVELLTPNISVLYFTAMLDLSSGPIVLKVPAGLQGAVNNLYQQPVVDIGRTGPDKGMGGTYLILPPNYNGTVPSGYFVEKSDTTQGIVMGRAFIDSYKNTTSGVETIRQAMVYPLSESGNPPQQKFVDASGQQAKLQYPTTEGFWEFLHKTYSKEQYVRAEDQNLVGMMHVIGIIPGQPFNPDNKTKIILDEAAIVGNLMAKNIAYDSPIKNSWVYYPGKNWELMFQTNNPSFEDERNATQIIPRFVYLYPAASTADNMVLKQIGYGSKYLSNSRDANDNYLVGSNTYKLHVLPNPPAEQFWSVVAYDTETRSLIKNDVQSRSGITSINLGNATQNNDGSYDIYFGPEPPAGQEDNWIKTNPDEGFFVLFRFYGPTEAFYDKSWQLPDIELVKGDARVQ
jgi:hypothetical protein